MKENPVKHRLAAGEVVSGSFLVDFNVPGIPRVMAAAGSEFVLFDQEHTAWSTETLRPLLRECHAAATVPLVRVPALERHLISAVLDAGAMGVMVPMVESARQAREIVEAAKYPPEGRRGLGPLYPDELDGDMASTMSRLNRETMVIAMVETRDGVAHVGEIAAIDGIDMLWIGHGDLTNSLGISMQFDDSRYLEAIARILAAGAQTDTPVGMMASSAAEVPGFLERGLRCIGFSDRALYAGALGQAHAAVTGA